MTSRDDLRDAVEQTLADLHHGDGTGADAVLAVVANAVKGLPRWSAGGLNVYVLLDDVLALVQPAVTE